MPRNYHREKKIILIDIDFELNTNLKELDCIKIFIGVDKNHIEIKYSMASEQCNKFCDEDRSVIHNINDTF